MLRRRVSWPDRLAASGIVGLDAGAGGGAPGAATAGDDVLCLDPGRQAIASERLDRRARGPAEVTALLAGQHHTSLTGTPVLSVFELAATAPRLAAPRDGASISGLLERAVRYKLRFRRRNRSRAAGGQNQDQGNLVSNMVNDLNLTDMETCYKMIRADVLRRLRLSADTFTIEPEITCRLSQWGARIYEMPISYERRGYDEGKKIIQEKCDEIKRLAEEGWNNEDICKKLGIPLKTKYLFYKYIDGFSCGAYRKANPEIQLEIVNDYVNNLLSVYDIEKKYEIDTHGVQDILKKHGVLRNFRDTHRLKREARLGIYRNIHNTRQY